MDTVVAYMPSILQGTLITIAIALCSVILAVLLGLLGAWAKLSKSRLAQNIGAAYTTLIRGVPDLVLMLLLFFGGQTLPVGNIIDEADIANGTVAGMGVGVLLGQRFDGAHFRPPKGLKQYGRPYYRAARCLSG